MKIQIIKHSVNCIINTQMALLKTQKKKYALNLERKSKMTYKIIQTT